MAKGKTKAEPGWLDKQAAAAALGIKERQFDSRHRRMIGDEHVKLIDRRPFFFMPAIIEALVTEARDKALLDSTGPDGILMTGPDSPELRRFRKLRGDLLEIELNEKTKALVNIALLDAAVRPALAVMRQTGDRLVREFGNAAGEVFNEGASEFEAAMVRTLETFSAKEKTA